MAIGLILGIGWFAFNSNTTNPAVDQATISSTSQNNTVNQTTYDSTDTSVSTEPTTEPSTPSQSTLKLISAQVMSLIDGDKIEVKIDGKTEKVRLIGVDTPETKHPSKPVYHMDRKRLNTIHPN